MLLGCSRAPAEPEPSRIKPQATVSSTALQWTVPPSWSVERLAERGKYRAKYQIPQSGNDKHPANLLVSRPPSSAAGTQPQLDELTAAFERHTDGPRTDAFEVKGLSVKMLEIAGTYRFPVGPAMGKTKRHAAHVMKEGWRALAASVDAKDRGQWFFRLVGPDETVQAAKSSFRSMIKSLK